MAKDKYEISLWEDYEVAATSSVPSHYEERKIAVIGSDTMTSPCRALEPKLVENINGTNTFTFKMLYLYDITDIEEARARGTINESNLTWIQDDDEHDKYRNPFESLLANERKVKVFWKNKWYDLVIKNKQEDSSGRSITYTCKDLFINELSKTGFDLVFDNELENNQGTAPELVEKVLEGTDWQFGGGDTIQQEKEEPVFEGSVVNNFKAQNQSNGNTAVTISSGKTILIYYQQVQDYLTSSTSPKSFQFAYADEYKQDTNSQLVINADCYIKNNVSFSRRTVDDTNYIDIKVGATTIVTFVEDAISSIYRASHLVQSQICKLDPLTEKYCYVYKAKSNNGDKYSKDDEIYMYRSTEYQDATFVNNLIVNGSGFTSTEGWSTPNSSDTPVQRLHPDYDETISWSPVALLKFKQNAVYTNYGIRQNSNFILEGFKIGEKFVLRVKARQSGTDELPTDNYFDQEDFHIAPIIKDKDETSYFSRSAGVNESGNWIRYILTCTKSITRAEIYSKNLNLFITPDQTAWIEEIQLFPYVLGVNNTRINPGSYDVESVAQVHYFYYNHTKSQGLASADDIKYLYTNTSEWNNSALVPQYNENFEKIRSINAKQTNRFNLLQSIAETFECWIRFTIQHDSTGRIVYTNGIPQKYVSVVKEIGQQTGIGFIYGIDLKTISRTIKSDQIVTKTIVPQNSNEFGTNGFCTIARSEQNYPRTNFILNFDYYITHDLINSGTLNRDLYLSVQNPNSSTNRNKPNAYYFSLNKWNTEYDSNIEWLSNKRTELDKQNSYLALYQDTLIALKQQKNSIENELIGIAGATSWTGAQKYLNKNKNKDEIKSRLAARSSVTTQINLYNGYVKSVSSSVKKLEKAITTKEAAQEKLLQYIKEKNFAFYKKYSRFIQEGTWKSEEYIDDNLYYLDAQNVAYTSSRPQIEYNISVLRLSSIEEFKNKVFCLGDIAYIQDTEFFGYVGTGANKTPYKEQVLVSEITSNFDEPEKDSFKIQNYKTQFEDLFQRITSTTQSLQYAEGSYAKAASIVDDKGTIKYDTLQSSIAVNEQLVISAKNEAVFSDATGLTVASTVYPNNKTKITSGGVFITTDGGTTWKSAVRGDGLSTENLAAGAISANNINIIDGQYSAFRWDSQGITAFWNDAQGINTTRFVRYDHYGIYGLNGIDNFDPDVEENSLIGEEKIWAKASMGMTWHGFFLKNSDGTGSVQITSDEDIRVLASNGTSETERIKIGRLYTNGEKGYEVYSGSYISGQTYYIKNGPWYDVADTRIWKSGVDYYLGNYELTNLFNQVVFGSESFTKVTKQLTQECPNPDFYYRAQPSSGFAVYGGTQFLTGYDYYVYENDNYVALTAEQKLAGFDPDTIYYTFLSLPSEVNYYKYDNAFILISDDEKQNPNPNTTYYTYGVANTGGFDSNIDYYTKTDNNQYYLVTENNPNPAVNIDYYTFNGTFDPNYTYYIYTDGGYIAIDTEEAIPQYSTTYYTFNSMADNCYIKNSSGIFIPATTPLDPNIEYYILHINSTSINKNVVDQPSRNETYYILDNSQYREAIATDYDEGFIVNDKHIQYYTQVLNTSYGIRISDRNGSPVMETVSNGTLWLKKALYIGENETDSAYNVSIGFLDRSNPIYSSHTNLEAFDPNYTYYELVNGEYVETSDSSPDSTKTYYTITEVHQVFNSNNNFIVYEDGSIVANDGTFSGVINATGGYFGTGTNSIGITDSGLVAMDGSSIIIEGGTFEIYSNPVYELYDPQPTSFIEGNDYYYKSGNEYILETASTPRSGVSYYSKNRGERIFYFDKDTNLLNAIGYVEARDGVFTGNIYARDGTFNGIVNAKGGIIGGFRIFDNQLASTDKVETNRRPFEVAVITDDQFQPGINYYVWDASEGKYVKTSDVTPDPQKDYYTFTSGLYIKVNGDYQEVTPETDIAGINTYYIEEQNIKLLGTEGSIEANKIVLGTGATIKEYIYLGNNVKLLNSDLPENGDRYLVISENNVEKIVFKNDGTIQLGAENGIFLDGTNASINGGNNNTQNYFNITPERAMFQNIVASGKISTVVFEQDHVQAVGGSMVFKPTFKVESYEEEAYESHNYYKIIFDSSIKDYIPADKSKYSYLVDLNGTLSDPVIIERPAIYTPYDPQPSEEFELSNNYYEKINDDYVLTQDTIPDEGKTYYQQISILEDNEAFVSMADVSDDIIKNLVSIIIIGQIGDILIGINSNDSSSQFHRPRGMTISDFRSTENGFEYPIKVFLGDMDAAALFSDSSSSIRHGFGLYTENAYLNGSLTTRVRNRDISESITYAGVNTLNGTNATKFNEFAETSEDDSSIIFWAGAKSETDADIQNSPFQVTEKGSLYASQGVFEGAIITRSEIRGADIYAARIHGTGKDEDPVKDYGLAFYNMSQGIVFKRGGDNDTDATETFRIGQYGLAQYDKDNDLLDYFISINDYSGYMVPHFYGFDFIAKNPTYSDATVIRHDGIYWAPDKNKVSASYITHHLIFTENNISFYKTSSTKYFEIDITNEIIKNHLKTTYISEILSLQDKMKYEPATDENGYNLYIN